MKRHLLRFGLPVFLGLLQFLLLFALMNSSFMPEYMRGHSTGVLFIASIAVMMILQIGFYYPIFFIADRIGGRSNKVLSGAALIVPFIYSVIIPWIFTGKFELRFFTMNAISIPFHLFLMIVTIVIWIKTRPIKNDIPMTWPDSH